MTLSVEQLLIRMPIDVVPRKTVIEPVHTLPFTKDPDFVGRVEVLRELDTRFLLNSSLRVELVGLGGMG